MIETGSHQDQDIPLADVQFHPASYADTHGRVFLWNGNVLRAIDPAWCEFYRSLLEAPAFRSLVYDGLMIDSEPSGFSIDGYPLVVQHRRLNVVSYPFEWCFDALKDAALLILSLQERLLAEGLMLQDAHPWNVMFDGCRPLYVDLGSIMPAAQEGTWGALSEFRQQMLNSLILMSRGHSKIVRAVLRLEQGISDGESASICAQIEKHPYRSLRRAARRLRQRLRWNAKVPLAQTLAQLRSEVELLSFTNAKTEWSSYDQEFAPLDSPSYANLKQEGVLRVLSSVKPVSVLDVASNRGWYAQLAAARFGCNVIAFDIDEASILQLFRDGKESGLPLHPLVMDICHPSPGLGPLCRSSPPAFERFKSDMVLALAIVHHLVFKKMLRFDQIVETLAAFSNKWLLVEFVPKEDKHVSKWWSERYSWYTLSGFKAELGKYFTKIETIESDIHPRVMLLCEV